MPGGSPSAAFSARASSGVPMIWTSAPVTNARGWRKTPTKSATFNVAPMPSIASASCTAANHHSWRT